MDPHSYEATKAVAKKAQKKFWGLNRIWAHDLHNTDALPTELQMYETLLGAGQEGVQFIPVI